MGTNNEERLNDPLYLGIRKRRIRGDACFDLIDRFVQAVRRHFPGAILQREDFRKPNTFALLDRYREQLPSFNDDIQGTGAVTLAGILGAVRIIGGRLADQRFLIHGARPEEIYRWTDGKAIVATGSPFPNVRYGGKEYLVGQGNNVFVFPGAGLAALLAGAKRITDGMFTAAANRLAEQVPAERLAANCVHPPVSKLRGIRRETAIAAAESAMEEGVAAPVPADRLPNLVERRVWTPRYARFRRRERAGAGA